MKTRLEYEVTVRDTTSHYRRGDRYELEHGTGLWIVEAVDDTDDHGTTHFRLIETVREPDWNAEGWLPNE